MIFFIFDYNIMPIKIIMNNGFSWHKIFIFFHDIIETLLILQNPFFYQYLKLRYQHRDFLLEYAVTVILL